jgi:hypothetical protein
MILSTNEILQQHQKIPINLVVIYDLHSQKLSLGPKITPPTDISLFIATGISFI